MAAMTGSCHNPEFMALYERLTNRGKPAKVALTAVMRKMVVLANRLMADPDFQLHIAIFQTAPHNLPVPAPETLNHFRFGEADAPVALRVISSKC
jgi:hypothetical protein